MKILVLGGDGYLGWPTALHLSARGHVVTVVDNMVRREYDREMGVDSLVPIASLAGPGDQVGADLRPRRRRPRRKPDRRRLHLQRGGRGQARRHRPLRRAAFGSLLHDRPRARGLHTGQQRRREPERDVRDSRDRSRHPPRQARDDGGVRLPQHRHRRGLHRDHAQGADRRAALPQAARFLLPPVQGARQPQHHVRLSHLGPAGHRPQPGHRLRAVHRGDGPGPACWPLASTTTACSARS